MESLFASSFSVIVSFYASVIVDDGNYPRKRAIKLIVFILRREYHSELGHVTRDFTDSGRVCFFE